MADLKERAQTLLDLHRAPEILVLTNVWDVASAQVVAGIDGVKALATASHAISNSLGYADGEKIPLEEHLAMVERITSAVDLPVSMDFEAGYGNPGETARRAIEAGVVGGNLEDQMKPLDQAVAAVDAVMSAGRDAGIEFVLNARTDVFTLREKGADRKELMREAVRRGKAFLAAGAPVVFVPGVMTADEIEVLTGELGPQKATLIAVPGVTPPVTELERMGVARVSTGPFTQYAALNALRDAATALINGGQLPPEAMPKL